MDCNSVNPHHMPKNEAFDEGLCLQLHVKNYSLVNNPLNGLPRAYTYLQANADSEGPDQPVHWQSDQVFTVH